MPHLIFTLDFHALVRGKLQPGTSCQIDYDPQRILPAAEGYRHGDPAYPVTAHIRYLPSGQEEEILLFSRTGVLKEVITKMDGQGSMLQGNLQVPANAEEIVVWFSAKAPSGPVYYDSNSAANYHFRFWQNDIQLKDYKVETHSVSPWADLIINLVASPAIEKVIARYRILNGEHPYTENECVLVARAGHSWSAEAVKVPYNSVVAFDILYYLGGIRYKSDNDGNYYLCEVVHAEA